MCTILSVGTEKISDLGRVAFVDRIASDYQTNHDGMTVVAMGKYPSIIRTMDAQSGLDSVERFLADESVFRVFVHMRAATTGYTGVDYCHGWTDGKGMLVLHNGILYTGNARKHAVDSMQLVRLMEQGYKPDQIHSILEAMDETFANIFFVDTDTGYYWLSTQSSYGVHADGKGNYSTKPIPELGITRAVMGPLINAHRPDGLLIVPAASQTSYFMPWANED